MEKIKDKKQNRNKLLISIILAVVIIVVMLMFQRGGETIIPNLGGILPIGDKSLQPPALPE